MAIPDYQNIMLPLLELAADQQEHSMREAIDTLAEQFNLNQAERNELLPSGQQAVFDNRVGWARTYLKKAGLFESTRRSFFQTTNRGLEVLKQDPVKTDNKLLQQFPEFMEFKARGKKGILPKQTQNQEGNRRRTSHLRMDTKS